MNECDEIIRYQQILCPEGMPSFIDEYSSVPEMRRLRGVGLFCGTDYSKLYNQRYFYSRYDHSLAAAMIVWHFTQDKKQTIAALLHDVATPVFSHSVDFMNGDALTQSSTEARTDDIIRKSAQIFELLKRDDINYCEINDYHRYPIADNDSPQCSADRLEYTFSTMLVWNGGWNLSDIAKMYNDIVICKNETMQDELGFLNIEIAEKFVFGSCEICKTFQQNENKLSLSFLGDMLKMAATSGVLTTDDMYTLTENEVIDIFANRADKHLSRAWNAYSKLNKVYGSESKPEGVYSVHTETKRRYINPLVVKSNGAVRIFGISQKAQEAINTYLSYRDKTYGFIEFTL